MPSFAPPSPRHSDQARASGTASVPSLPRRVAAFARDPGGYGGRSTSLAFGAVVLVGWGILGAVVTFLKLAVRAGMPDGALVWVLLIAACATLLWSGLVLLTQSEDDTEDAGGLVDYPGRHEYWRARTFAWGLFDVSFAASVFLGMIATVGNPYRVIPPADLPFVELGVLVVTIGILAQLTYFSARSSSTDLSRVAKEIETTSARTQTQFADSVGGLQKAFVEETRALLREVGDQGARQASLLAKMATSLDHLAVVVEEQLETGRQTRQLVKEAREEQRRAEVRAEEEKRHSEQERIEIAERERLRYQPQLAAQIRVTGTLWHHLQVDVSNRGMVVTGAILTVDTHGVLKGQWALGNLEGPTPKSTDAGDVGQVPNDTTIDVLVDVRDGQGRPYRCSAAFQYHQSRGILGQVRAQDIAYRPSGFVAMGAVQRPS